MLLKVVLQRKFEVLKCCSAAPASSKEFLDIQATIECGFTLKRVRDMTRTYSHTLLNKYKRNNVKSN